MRLKPTKKIVSLALSDYSAVLFDLDGTLADTAEDITLALNLLAARYGRPPLALDKVRPFIGEGSSTLVALHFSRELPNFKGMVQEFLQFYQGHLCASTHLFPGMEQVLNYLEQANIPWGIVTNKLSYLTLNLLDGLNLTKRAACIVSGDTLKTCKPAPDTILHACELIKKSPQQCIYVGDAATDIIASKAAGTFSLAALYGYIKPEENPYLWEADGYLNHPLDLLSDFTS